ncbi:MAG TPA: molybdate ABC transporter substrate-binding protein [Marmoricola sp.]|nr:molybdate ABC transporter substrate-binding protein [Marmoricola sp.]HNO38843.1 molybdate ABC transporter substrate-binding protein [Marmoricola sp.]
MRIHNARSPRRILGIALIMGLAIGWLAGCGKSEEKILTVFAAASLSKTFPTIAEKFEAKHEGVKVRFSFGGSSDLVEQIKAGSPADVFASADTANMDKLGDLAEKPATFATNTLQIVVPAGNPAGISTFADLAKPGLKLVICAPEVPCGSASQTAATAAGVKLKPVSEEQSVTDVLGKVTSGEADAGLVYVTDVRSAGDAVEGISFPESSAAVNSYPITALADAKHPELAQQFADFVVSPAGLKVLQEAGFGRP